MFMSLERSREGFLGPTAPFDSSGVDLLGSRGDYWPPGVGILFSDLWVRDGVEGRVLIGLGRRGDFLSPDTSFDSSGLDLLMGIWYELCSTGRRVGGKRSVGGSS